MQVKTGIGVWLTYSGVVASLRQQLGEPTSVLREPAYRYQYRYPPLLRKLEPAMRAPTWRRWVHFAAAGSDFCVLRGRSHWYTLGNVGAARVRPSGNPLLLAQYTRHSRRPLRGREPRCHGVQEKRLEPWADSVEICSSAFIEGREGLHGRRRHKRDAAVAGV